MTRTSKKSAFIATGLMLFALFFGAGNLIYPPVLGQQAGQAVGAALAGFLLTGVGLPLAGVLAIAYTGSRDLQDLAGRAGKAYGVFFSVALYLAIGSLFAAPRTATVSFVFTLVSLALANVGLSGIIKLSVPALMLLYPLTVVLIALAFLDRFFGGRRIVYACTVAATLPVALIDGWRTAHGMFGGASDGLIMRIDATLKNILPLYADGLGRVAPAAVGLAVGLVLAAAQGRAERP